jgi:hypothetical protein
MQNKSLSNWDPRWLLDGVERKTMAHQLACSSFGINKPFQWTPDRSQHEGRGLEVQKAARSCMSSLWLSIFVVEVHPNLTASCVAVPCWLEEFPII